MLRSNYAHNMEVVTYFNPKLVDNNFTMCKYIAQFCPLIRASNETNSGIKYSR